MGFNLIYPTSERQLKSASMAWLFRGDTCNLCRKRRLLASNSCISKNCLLRLLKPCVQVLSNGLRYLCLSEPRDRSSATFLNSSWEERRFCVEQLKCRSRMFFCTSLFLNFEAPNLSYCFTTTFAKWSFLPLFEI